jgi:hypothetical protein
MQFPHPPPAHRSCTTAMLFTTAAQCAAAPTALACSPSRSLPAALLHAPLSPSAWSAPPLTHSFHRSLPYAPPPPPTPSNPHMHSPPQALASSSSFLLVADPNLLTAFAYSYTGAFIRSHDLSRATPAIFVYGMRIDESVSPSVVYVCGSYRSQTCAPPSHPHLPFLCAKMLGFNQNSCQQHH